MIGYNHCARYVHCPGVPPNTLRHVACARGIDTIGERCFGRQGHGVTGASQLERPDRLKVFELEVEFSGKIFVIESYQRRAVYMTLNAPLRRLDFIKRYGIG